MLRIATNNISSAKEKWPEKARDFLHKPCFYNLNRSYCGPDPNVTTHRREQLKSSKHSATRICPELSPQ